MAKEPEFWTAPELAARLRVTTATIYRMARRGELPYYSIGRAMRFRAHDICRAPAPSKIRVLWP